MWSHNACRLQLTGRSFLNGSSRPYLVSIESYPMGWNHHSRSCRLSRRTMLNERLCSRTRTWVNIATHIRRTALLGQNFCNPKALKVLCGHFE